MNVKHLITILAVSLIPVLILGQFKSYPVKLIKPSGDRFNGYPVMEEYPDTSSAYIAVMEIINNSAVKEILELNRISQTYLHNKGIIGNMEPAYLALTENQGGYAKKGFYLMTGDGDTTDHRNTHYVDIILERLMSDYTGLMSFTQLYPHELAHVIYGQVSLKDSADHESMNVDMHYFPVITDYSTAFNEGFAIHFENISRLIEKNPDIRSGIQEDLERIKRRTPPMIDGFLKDVRYPFRLGYYKSSVILWFQQYEDYRRHQHALDASIKYINRAPEIGSIEDQLTIRNMGILYSRELRNPVQSIATEGVIASLFTKFFQSKLGSIYYEPSFYKPFLADTSMQEFNPGDYFSPLENLFIKYFLVLHRYVSKFNTSRVQLLDFLHGYKELFPEEASVLDSVYYTVTGHSIPDKLPPQIWMMVKDYEHRMLAIDPFDAAVIQTYTFDLNAAGKVDLMTIPGLSEQDAESILRYRNENGLFDDIDKLNDINDLSAEGKSALFANVFDKEYFYAMPEPSLSFSAIKSAPLKSYLKRVIIYMGLLIVFLNLFLLNSRGWLKRTWISLRYSLLWLLLTGLGAAAVILINSPLLWALVVVVVFNVITIVFYRRKNLIKRNLVMLNIMGLIVLLSMM